MNSDQVTFAVKEEEEDLYYKVVVSAAEAGIAA